MYCRNCGKGMDAQAVVCVACGSAVRAGNKYCQNCGEETPETAEVCPSCGVRLGKPGDTELKSKLIAGLLGIFIGALGIHRFYLGYTGIGLTQLLLTVLGSALAVCTFGITAVIPAGVAIWGLIEGILILTGSINKDAKGWPLRD
ncbi:MAG: NINE protein [candidate division Zixibacteria bacterium]|nr:NINE protein [candidate division Zixibacteria bacterium]